MNTKADKSQLKWPPLLNLADDKPHIDTSFQNWEKVNGPYLNSMLQPVWLRRYADNTYYYTKNGKRYRMSGGHLQENERNLSPTIDAVKFKKSDMNALGRDILAVSLWSESYYIAVRRTSTGVDILNSQSILRSYEINGAVIDSRVLVKGRDNIMVVIAYVQGTSYKVLNVYVNLVSRLVLDATADVTWRIQNGFTSEGESATIATLVTLDNLRVTDPVITGFCNNNNLWFISLTSSYGEVEDTKKNGFFTYAIKIGGNLDLKPISTFKCTNNGATSYDIVYSRSIFLKSASNDSSTTKLYLSSNGRDYYDYLQNASNPVGPKFNFPSGVIPGTTGRSIVVKDGDDSTTYTIYSITITERKRSITLTGDPNRTYTLKAAMVDGMPSAQIVATAGTISGTEITNTGIGEVKVEYVLTQYSTQAGITAGWKFDSNIVVNTGAYYYYIDPKIYLNNSNGYVYEQTTGVSGNTGKSATVPAIAGDDGYFYSLWTFNVNKNTAVNNNQGWSNYHMVYDFQPYICMKGSLNSYSDTTLTVNQIVSTNQNVNGCYAARSNSFVIDQGLFIMTAKFCNDSTCCPKDLAANGKELAGARFSEWTFSNRYAFKYMPGTSRQSSFNYYSYEVTGDASLSGSSEDLLVYTVGGYRVPIKDGSPYYLLYNVTSSGFAYIQGISYAGSTNSMGTLLTPWESIDESSYITAYNNVVLYKDKSGKWHKINTVTGNDITTLLDDRYVLINTTSYLNMYDSETGKWFHYASDYNGRLMHGQNTNTSISGVLATGEKEYSAYPYIRYTANGINPLYQVMPRDPICSLLLPIVPRYRCGVMAEQLYDCTTPTYAGIQGVDVFFSEYANTTCKYRFTLNSTSGQLQRYAKSELTGLLFPGTTSSSATLTPNIFTKYINGAGNNDMVIEDFDSYVLTYYDNRPYFIYSASTQVSTTYGSEDAFFVLQGQFYGVIGDKLYSLIYSNGAISQMDAIIDIVGLKFLGNTPMIAFFYDDAHKVIKSFTGDANLDTLYSATKLSGITGLHFYDTQTQSIYIPTSIGLFVIGPRNMYILDKLKRVTRVSFDNNGFTHIINGSDSYDLTYYKYGSYEVEPLDLETSFYGYGATENISIDRWNITLYDLDGDHSESYVTVGVRSITDVTVLSEEKTIKITPNMYDKWSNSVFIAFNPKLIKGQGLRLYIKTPLIVQSVTAHIMDNKTGTLTKHSL